MTAPGTQPCPLSPAELLLVKNLAEGHTRDEAARRAGYGPGSQNTIMHRIFRKTGARNSVHLTAIALRNGWIS